MLVLLLVRTHSREEEAVAGTKAMRLRREAALRAQGGHGKASTAWGENRGEQWRH
jgi:hypothetical protein